MVKIAEYNKQITKQGNSYAIIVPKALIDCGVFKEREEVHITLDKVNCGSKDLSLESVQLAAARVPEHAGALDWAAVSPLEKPEGKPLNKTVLEARRAKGSLLSLDRALFCISSFLEPNNQHALACGCVA